MNDIYEENKNKDINTVINVLTPKKVADAIDLHESSKNNMQSNIMPSNGGQLAT